MAKIMEIISKETGGKSYNTEKYSYDTIGMPSFDYDDDGEKFIKWQVSGETEKHKTYVDLTNEAKRQIGKRPVISYFLDGSRHTYKVDDISYNKRFIQLSQDKLVLDVANVPMEECDPKNFTDDWFCHFQRLVTQMAGRMMYFLQLKRKSSIKVKN